jgi:hypothetical protein
MKIQDMKDLKVRYITICKVEEWDHFSVTFQMEGDEVFYHLDDVDNLHFLKQHIVNKIALIEEGKNDKLFS